LDSAAVIQFARHLPVRFVDGKIWLEEQEVTDVIRTEQVAALASQVAVIPAVRAALLAFQQDCAQAPGLVADGRDMGSVVFKNALAKLFLEANATVRAERRVKQLKNQGLDANIVQITQEIKERDERDRNRSVAPLIAAADALVIETSHLTADDVFKQAIAWIDNKFAGRK
jgi:cytidylate kinase